MPAICRWRWWRRRRLAVSKAEPAWGCSLAVVLAVHAGLLYALLAGRQASPPLPGDQKLLQVAWAELPSAPEVAAHELPPGELQTAQAGTRTAPPPRPAPLPDIPRLPEGQLALPAQPVPSPQSSELLPEAAENLESREASAPPAADGLPASQYAASATVSGTQGAAEASWQGLLLGHLERYRRYPPNARRAGQQGIAQIGFKVDSQGQVSDITLVASSGHALLDEAALSAIARANPVPPPPESLSGNLPLQVRVPVSFFIKRRR